MLLFCFYGGQSVMRTATGAYGLRRLAANTTRFLRKRGVQNSSGRWAVAARPGTTCWRVVAVTGPGTMRSACTSGHSPSKQQQPGTAEAPPCTVGPGSLGGSPGRGGASPASPTTPPLCPRRAPACPSNAEQRTQMSGPRAKPEPPRKGVTPEGWAAEKDSTSVIRVCSVHCVQHAERSRA